MDYCSCIIHYDFLSTSDKLTSLSEVSFQTLTECKKIRESLGGENHHEEQCKGIPTVLTKNHFSITGNATKNLPMPEHCLNEN